MDVTNAKNLLNSFYAINRDLRFHRVAVKKLEGELEVINATLDNLINTDKDTQNQGLINERNELQKKLDKLKKETNGENNGDK